MKEFDVSDIIGDSSDIILGQQFGKFWDNVNNFLYSDNRNIAKLVYFIDIKNIQNFQTFINLVFGLRKIYNQDKNRVAMDIKIKEEFKSDSDIIDHAWSFMIRHINEKDEYKLSGFSSAELGLVNWISEQIFEINQN